MKKLKDCAVKKEKKRLTVDQVRERQRKNKTLIIEYDAIVGSTQKHEGFRNVIDPDRIISRRNAGRIRSVTYMGDPYDISKHKKLYPVKKTEKL